MVTNGRNLARGAIGAVLCTILLASCEEPRNNPIDPGGGTFQPPQLTFISEPSADIPSNVDYVSFAWSGNTQTCRFRFSLSDSLGRTYQPITAWIQDSSVTFVSLDDSRYTFILEAKYETIDSITRYDRSFIIDAASTPAVAIMKKMISARNGDEVNAEVWVKKVQNLFAGDLSIGFDKNMLRLVGVTNGDLPGSQFTELLAPDFTKSSVVASANSSGQVRISVAFLPTSSTGRLSLSGTGCVLKLKFRAVSTGTSHLDLQQVDLRDADNSRIGVAATVSGTVVIN